MKIHKKVKEQYPDATDADLVGAFAFADDVFLLGDLANTITLPWINERLAEETELQLVTSKCVAITSRARSDDDEVFNALQQQEVAVQRDCGVMMGVPFGTDDFIDNHVSKLVDNYIGDLQALQYF